MAQEQGGGAGNLSEVLEERGYNVISTDLVDRGYGSHGIDFLKTDGVYPMDILTNPPYKYADKFVSHALDILDEGSEVGQYSVGNIGRRSEVISDDKINCVFEQEVPDVVFNQPESTATTGILYPTGYAFIILPILDGISFTGTGSFSTTQYS